MAWENILMSDFAVQLVYPFLLVFVIVFAILQKSKILGDDKRQIDALVSLAVALIVIAFSWATDIIAKLMPFLAIGIVVLLVFLLLYGFVASDKDEGLKLHKNLKIAIGVVIVIFVVIAVIVATGKWDTVYNSIFKGEGISDLWANILLIAIVGGVLAIVIFTGRDKKSSSSSKED